MRRRRSGDFHTASEFSYSAAEGLPRVSFRQLRRLDLHQIIFRPGLPPALRLHGMSRAGDGGADGDRSRHEMPNLKWSEQRRMAQGMEPYAGGTSALAAVGRSTKNARLYPGV